MLPKPHPPRLAGAMTLAAGGVLLSAIVAEAQAPGILDRTALTYRSASFEWMERLHPLAMATFIPLAGIEFALSGLLWTLNDIETNVDVEGQFLRKFFFLSCWLTILFTW